MAAATNNRTRAEVCEMLNAVPASSFLAPQKGPETPSQEQAEVASGNTMERVTVRHGELRAVLAVEVFQGQSVLSEARNALRKEMGAARLE